VATAILPVTFSAAVGLNITPKEALCPAARVIGVVIPLIAKFFAFTVTFEIVTAVLPLLVMVTLFELELPAFTPEKLRLLGFDESVTDAAVPVPLKDKTFGEFGASLEILTVPV
jgi:hypothetical protein